MKFSICTPTYYNKEAPENVRQPRYEMFLRCANSVAGQTFRDFEWVIADDICVPKVTREMLPASISEVNIVRLPEKSGRIVGRNQAMKASNGDWICWLDADDEYASIYLEAIDKATKAYPDFKVFNMNHLVYSYDFHTSVRKFLDLETIGDRPFGSGTIGAGAYVFHRSVYEAIGPIPELGLWDFAKNALDEFPEIKPFFWVEDKQSYNSLGNPWGEDYYYFYKMTRKFKSKYLDTALYLVHSHYGHRFKEDPDYELGEDKKPEWNPNLK